MRFALNSLIYYEVLSSFEHHRTSLLNSDRGGGSIDSLFISLGGEGIFYKDFEGWKRSRGVMRLGKSWRDVSGTVYCGYALKVTVIFHNGLKSN